MGSSHGIHRKVCPSSYKIIEKKWGDRMNIYVGNLSFDVTEEDLRQAFDPFGQISSVRVITDRNTGRSKGFAYLLWMAWLGPVSFWSSLSEIAPRQELWSSGVWNLLPVKGFFPVSYPASSLFASGFYPYPCCLFPPLGISFFVLPLLAHSYENAYWTDYQVYCK